MEANTIGRSKEEYLKAILIVKKKYGACRCVDVANHLGVTNPSTSAAVKKLEKEGFVERNDWRILLTPKGQELAESLYEKDMFFTNWFKAIGVSEETAEVDACLVEHAISDETYIKICDFLKEKMDY